MSISVIAVRLLSRLDQYARLFPFDVLGPDVKATMVYFGSVAAVTNAIAADATRGVSPGTPATTPEAIDPETSSASNVRAPDGVAPHVGSADDGTFGPMSGGRAGGGLDASLRRLQEAYLALDALRAARNAQSGTEKGAMDLVK